MIVRSLAVTLVMMGVVSLQAIAQTTDSKTRTWTDATGVFSVLIVGGGDDGVSPRGDFEFCAPDQLGPL